tara:strand:- start:117 stop:434 length:318 start_codon:yes stop_codon:yes gene_type:complete
VEIPVEYCIVFIGLCSGLCFILGSIFSPSVKKYKAEIKYLEGKYYKKIQQLQDQDQDKGFDLGSIFGGGGVGDILKFVEKNPDVLQKLLSLLNPSQKKNPSFELR